MESFKGQLARLELMSRGDDSWDLSDNDQAALKAVLESHSVLLNTLKSAVMIAADAFEAWDSDNDMRCGKILRYLGDSKIRGYRLDIDAVHEVIKRAEAR